MSKYTIHTDDESLGLCQSCIYGEKVESELTFSEGAYLCHECKRIPSEKCYKGVNVVDIEDYLTE